MGVEPERDDVALCRRWGVIEESCELGNAVGAQAEPTRDSVDLVVAELADHLHLAPRATFVHVEAQRDEHRFRIVCGWGRRLGQSVQRGPVRRQPGHRMERGQLNDNASMSVGCQLGCEGREVGDVVDDVVADHDVRGWHPSGRVGPGAFDLGVSDAKGCGAFGERREQSRAGVDAGDVRGPKAEAGGAGAHADVEHRSRGGQRAAGDLVGRSVFGACHRAIGRGREDRRIEEVRRLGRVRDQLSRYRPAGQHLLPAVVQRRDVVVHCTCHGLARDATTAWAGVARVARPHKLCSAAGSHPKVTV